jgi:hypothetical protein
MTSCLVTEAQAQTSQRFERSRRLFLFLRQNTAQHRIALLNHVS